MANTPHVHPTYVSMNRPLTIGGAERRLFFLALVVGAATFTFFGRLLAGILMFLALYVAARWMTQTDPQLLRIALRSLRLNDTGRPGGLIGLMRGGRRAPNRHSVVIPRTVTITIILAATQRSLIVSGVGLESSTHCPRPEDPATSVAVRLAARFQKGGRCALIRFTTASAI